MIHNKKIKVFSIIVGILLVLVVFLNYFASDFIENKIKEAYKKQDTELHVSSVETVKFHFLERSIKVKNIQFKPTEKAFSLLKDENSPTFNLNKINISSIKLRGIQFLKILLDDEIDINQLRLENVKITRYINSQKKYPDSLKKPIRLDSISIKKINGLVIKKVFINMFDIETIDVHNDKKTSQININKLQLGGLALNKVQNEIFELEAINKALFIDHLTANLFEAKYKFNIEKVEMDLHDNVIRLNNMKFDPIGDKYSITKTFKYNKAVFDLIVPEVNIYNLNFDKAINNQGIFIDSIAVSGVDADIYKDRRIPFDFRRRPKLPNQALKSLSMPLRIKKIKVNNSKLRFEEVLEKKDIHLKLYLFDINTQITNITSVKEFMDQPMKFSFNSKFMNDAILDVKMTFPLNERGNRFYMDGRISKSKFKYFDSAIYPALGIKILRGDLDGLTFNAVADESVAKGEMILLYHNLETEVFKKKSRQRSKFLSWSVNGVLHNSNPVKGKKPRIAIIDADRIIYKGFINYVWITAQSGIINTLLPVGAKTVQKEKAKAARKKKREERKKRK